MAPEYEYDSAFESVDEQDEVEAEEDLTIQYLKKQIKRCGQRCFFCSNMESLV